MGEDVGLTASPEMIVRNLCRRDAVRSVQGREGQWASGGCPARCTGRTTLTIRDCRTVRSPAKPLNKLSRASARTRVLRRRQGCPYDKKQNKIAGLWYTRTSAERQLASNCVWSSINRPPLSVNPHRLSANRRRLNEPCHQQPLQEPLAVPGKKKEICRPTGQPWKEK